MTGLVPPRDDLRALEGYHSPQLDVSVRLNTNESPFPPPPEFVEAWTAALRDAPLHRYPDRAAGDLRAALGDQLGQPAERIFCANGSNEVLQTLLLTYGGAGRKAAVFEPTYALHSHIARITATEVVVGERRADFSIDPEVAVALIERERPTLTFVCSPNNPTGTVEPASTIDAIVAATDGLVVVDEAYGEFAPRSALDLVRDDGRLVVVRTYSKVWSMAALRLGYAVAPTWVIEELDKVVLPYHLDVATQLAGKLALGLAPEMGDRVHRLVDERERVAKELSALAGIEVYPSGANFVLFRVQPGSSGAAHTDGHAVWERMVAQGVLVRDFSRWPRLAECLRVTIGTPDENDAFLGALPRRAPGGSCLMSRSSHQSRSTAETTIELDLEIDGSGTAKASTGIPFFDHMLEQLGKHGGFDLTIDAQGDLDVDTHHTVEDVGIVFGTALKEALGDKAGVRRFADSLVPLDEALVQVALDLSGRPFLVYEVDPVAEWIGTFDPQLAEEFWRAFAFGAGITLHIRSVAGKNGHHVIEASFKGVARALRDAVRVEGTGVPSTKGTL